MNYTIEELKKASQDSRNFNEVVLKLGFARGKTTIYCRILSDMLANNIDYSHLSRKSKYSQEQIQMAAKNSRSITEMLRNMGIKNIDNVWGTIKFEILRWQIDISHFDGRQHLLFASDRLAKKYTPIELILSNQIPMKSSDLKKRLISAGRKKEKCEKCCRTHHNGEPIDFELNHINGNKHDNQLENLEILCPNCHSLTFTFAGNNKATQFSDAEVLAAIKQTNCLSNTIKTLTNSSCLPEAQRKKVREIISRLKPDLSHWSWPVIFKPQPKKYKLNNEILESLTENSKIRTNEIKNYLIREGIKKRQCEICNITDWDGVPLKFTLDHLNGVKNDHRLQNIRILCFICHSRTPNYKGKNIPLEKRGKSIPYQRSRDGLPSSHYDKR